MISALVLKVPKKERMKGPKRNRPSTIIST